jgi:solute carrier family 25 protein 44
MDSGQMIEWHHLDKQKFFVITPSLFFIVRGFVYPFNLIKTRLFMQEKKSMYKGTLDAFTKIARYEGIRGLYKGYLVSSLGLISGQVYIVSYELFRSHLKGYRTEMKGLIAGGCATLLGQTITVPVDVISQHRMMAGQVKQWKHDKVNKMPSTVEIVRKILKSQGPRGLFKGYVVSLLTYGPNSALWWFFYSGGYNKAVQADLLDILPKSLVQAAVGMCSATLTSILTNPMDVLRTRYQLEKSNSLRATLENFIRNEGFGGITKGLSARLASSLPTAAIMVTTYEWAKRASLKENYM